MYRFVLKNIFIKIYIYHFLINIFIKISSQNYTSKTVSLSKTTLFLSIEGVVETVGINEILAPSNCNRPKCLLHLDIDNFLPIQ